ncbi:nucleotidyltransferase domain-containing protein [Alteribacter natronophilus]|uniref:nucleotidyltransferase domain-containing protein n=1 Tax=Alteribacter natronophilus TaxID=2583810 RepID=UPI001FE2F9D6|nr:nucleotidyltransferase domain-containing protein [Alteribacter natronophilus]
MNMTDRDRSIPEERDKVRRALEEDLKTTDAVIGLFYGGSVATGTADLYSDLDLRIVVKEEKFKRFVNEKKKLPLRWGRVLFFEDTGSAMPYTIAHYEGFFKVDIFYYRPGDLAPGIWMRDISILHDPEGLIAAVQQQSLQVRWEISEEYAEKWRGKTLAYVHESYRRAMRGEWYYAVQCVDAVRWSIAAGWQMEMGLTPNNPMDWARLEGEKSPLTENQRKMLSHWWMKKRTIEEVDRVLRDMLEVYLPLENTVAGRSGLQVNENETRRVWEMSLQSAD